MLFKEKVFKQSLRIFEGKHTILEIIEFCFSEKYFDVL